MALTLGSGSTVEETLTNMMGKIGEKIQISNYQKLEGEKVVIKSRKGGYDGKGVDAKFTQELMNLDSSSEQARYLSNLGYNGINIDGAGDALCATFR